MRKQIVFPSGNVIEFDTDVKREKFDKDFSHITEDERNEAWNQTHPKDEPIAIPSSDKAGKKPTVKYH